MNIAIDADGVFLDFDATWRETAENVLCRKLSAPAAAYHLMDRYALTKAEYHKTWVTFNALGAWSRIKPIPEGVNAVRMMLDMGHEVHVVSCVPINALASRRQQMARLFGEHHPRLTVHATASQPGHEILPTKEQVLSAIHPHFYADDRWPHCLEARHAMVPYIAFIDARHGGDGTAMDDVHVHENLMNAIQDFSRMTNSIPHGLPARGVTPITLGR